MCQRKHSKYLRRGLGRRWWFPESHAIGGPRESILPSSFRHEGSRVFGLLIPANPSSPRFPQLERIMVLVPGSGLREMVGIIRDCGVPLKPLIVGRRSGRSMTTGRTEPRLGAHSAHESRLSVSVSSTGHFIHGLYTICLRFCRSSSQLTRAVSYQHGIPKSWSYTSPTFFPIHPAIHMSGDSSGHDGEEEME